MPDYEEFDYDPFWPAGPEDVNEDGDPERPEDEDWTAFVSDGAFAETVEEPDMPDLIYPSGEDGDGYTAEELGYDPDAPEITQVEREANLQDLREQIALDGQTLADLDDDEDDEDGGDWDGEMF